MPEDFFEDAPGKDAPMPEKGGGDDKMEKDDQPTFLINSEVCPDMKPGDMMQVRIVAVHDKEYEVSYQPEEKEEHDEQAPEEAPMPGGDGGGEMASMMD